MLALSCTGSLYGGEDRDGAAGKLPAPEASALWNHITQTDPYRSWSLYPARPHLYPSFDRGLIPAKNPHGAYLRLYGNDIAIVSAKEAEDLPMPNGAILIMEDFAKDKTTLLSLTVMYKVEGYNPQEGDWFWASYNSHGQAAESGKVQSCMECHRAQSLHDWRYTGAKPHQHN